jgi:hypothetical protein
MMAEAMVEASVRGAGEVARVWGAAGISADFRDRVAEEPRARALAARPVAARPVTFNAWLSAEEVALLILRGECAEAGISVPARFAPQAVASAISSVQRWTAEGRIFAIHDLYPRYQFDARGRPHPPVERALDVFGRSETLRVGNWFVAPNRNLGGKRPQELLATAPAFVVLALQKIGQVEFA